MFGDTIVIRDVKETVVNEYRINGFCGTVWQVDGKDDRGNCWSFRHTIERDASGAVTYDEFFCFRIYQGDGK